MPDDTSLMRMIIQGLAEKYGWAYGETMERFYQSKTCRLLSDRHTGMFTFAPREVISFFEEEINSGAELNGNMELKGL